MLGLGVHRSQKTNISTLSNWCTRMIPRVSFPCEPRDGSNSTSRHTGGVLRLEDLV